MDALTVAAGAAGALLVFVGITVVGGMIQHDTPLGVIGLSRALVRLGQRLQSAEDRAFVDVLDEFENNALLVQDHKRSIWWLLFDSAHFAGREGAQSAARVARDAPRGLTRRTAEAIQALRAGDVVTLTWNTVATVLALIMAILTATWSLLMNLLEEAYSTTASAIATGLGVVASTVGVVQGIMQFRRQRRR